MSCSDVVALLLEQGVCAETLGFTGAAWVQPDWAITAVAAGRVSGSAVISEKSRKKQQQQEHEQGDAEEAETAAAAAAAWQEREEKGSSKNSSRCRMGWRGEKGLS